MFCSLCCRSLLDSIVQEHCCCYVYYTYYDDGQNLQRDGAYELVSDEYTNHSAECLHPGCCHVVSSFFDELRAVTECHQECTGSHHYRECGSNVQSQQGAESHTRSVQSYAYAHQSAQNEVYSNCDEQLSAGQLQSGTDSTERSDCQYFAQHYGTEKEQSYEHCDTYVLSVQLGYKASHQDGAEYGCNNHGNQSEGIQVYESEEQECLEQYRDGVTYVQRSRNVDIVYGLTNLECCGRSGEGSDTQSITEVHDNSYNEVEYVMFFLLLPEFFTGESEYRIRFSYCTHFFHLSVHQEQVQNDADYA